MSAPLSLKSKLYQAAGMDLDGESNTPCTKPSLHALPNPSITSLVVVLRWTTTAGTTEKLVTRPLSTSHANAWSIARE